MINLAIYGAGEDARAIAGQKTGATQRLQLVHVGQELGVVAHLL